MRSVVYTSTGPSSVLHLTEREVPPVGPGEVRVKVAVSGVNPTDWKARAGTGDGAELGRELVPNQDGAGTVDAIGEGVMGFGVGDRVWVWDAAFNRDNGTAQEYVVLPARQVQPLPDHASFDDGASLGIPALTAHRALTASESGPARLEPGALRGHIVLVQGGAGAVSHAAIQLAVWAGATVITTVSGDEKAALARAAGAHHILNYKTEDVAARVREIAPGGANVIVEVSAAANLATDLDVVAANGTIAVYTSEGTAPLQVPARAAMTKNVRLQFILTYTTPTDVKDAAVAAVSSALADGALRVGDEFGLPITRFPLEQTAAAHDSVEKNAVGKVLVDVAR
jgi:NADPH2:quinone reductase